MKLRFLILPLFAFSFPFLDPCVSSLQKRPPQPKSGEIIYEVVTTTPRLEDKPRIITAVGTFTASENAVIRAEFSGNLEKVLVKEGDQVKANDTLCVFKGDDLKVEEERKKNEIREVQADLDHSKKILELQTTAKTPDTNSNAVFLDEDKEKVVPDKFANNPTPAKPPETEDWPTKIEMTQARLDSLLKDLELLESKMAKLNVAAPISGFIRKGAPSEGSPVEMGTSLFEIVSTDPITLIFEFPAEVSSYIDKQVSLQASPLSAPEIITNGEISFISPSLNTQRNTLEVRAHFPNTKGLIKEGQEGKAIVTTRKTDKLLIIPKEALIREAEQDFIYVVTGPQVRKTEVKVGESVGDKEVIVKANLRIDDPIVISGQANLKDLSFVKIIRETPPLNPANVSQEKPSSLPVTPLAHNTKA